MRNLFKATIIAISLTFGAVGVTDTANAGYRHYTLCWHLTSGGTDCVYLPRNYRLPGIKKPKIPAGTVSFRLTRNLINCILRRYVSTAKMVPGHMAKIYAPKA